jgi:hydrophobe/amphiphile efflux-1 (HAE1) family protein
MLLTEISIKKPVFAWMIMASFIIFGMISFNRLGISEKPDIDFPVVNITVEWPGAAPEVIELDVVDNLESALLSVEGVQKIISEARRGRAEITLEFDLDRNIDVALQEVQSILGRSQRNLPKDIIPPVVRKSNPEDRPILWLAVASDQMSRKELMTYVRDQIKDRFQTIEGVSEIILGGYVDPNLRVWLSEKKLRRYDLTALDVVRAIGNEHAEYPAGIFENNQNEYNIRMMGENFSVEDFSLLSINQRGGTPNYSPIPLSAVAEIQDDLDDVRRISRVMGKSSIGLGIRKQRGANSVQVGDSVKKRMNEIVQNLPAGTSIGVNYDGTTFIKDSIAELKFTLVVSAIVTALVVWFFLGSLGASLNIILSIPTAIIASFMALHFLGFTLNTFTMLGLTLAVGLVVDDNIMILENIMRVHKEGRLSPAQASLIGTNQISFAALAASTAIIAIFVPIGFISGIVGKYFNQFALTITAAICFSYVDAVTLTPMRAVYLLSQASELKRRWIDIKMEQWEEMYSRSLNWALNHRGKILLSGLFIFILTIGIYKALKTEFIPAQDQSRLMIMLKTKPGSSLAFTDDKVREIEKIFMSAPEIERYFVTIGGFSGGESNAVTSFVTLLPKEKRTISQQDFALVLKKKLSEVKGIFAMVQDPSLAGFSSGRSYPVEFILTGPDWNKLIELSEDFKNKLVASGLMVDADSNFKGMVPEVRIVPDRTKALARGVSIIEIGQTIQSMVSGVVAGKFAKGGRRYDIRVKIKDAEFKEIQDLSKILVRNNRGELIALSEVTKIETDSSLLSITRDDRARSISIYANLATKVAQGQAIDYVTNVLMKDLPNGYSLFQTGSSKTFKDSFSSLFFVFILGLIIAYMVLASQFNSFTHPLTILSILPFSFTGAFLALWMFDKTLNIYSLIGLILLMGIVKKNSIILVDVINQMRESGLSAMDAIKKACPLRLRPILMTSISTIIGTLPTAVLTGPGYETRMPMGIAVIGGATLATVLTLYIVPCLYSYIPGKVAIPTNG